MRVRIRIVGQEGEKVKLWAVVPKEAKTIKCFVKHVAGITDLPKKSIILNIDGFELPAKQPIELIREGDIVNVKVSCLSKKSKKSKKTKSPKDRNKTKRSETETEVGQLKKIKNDPNELQEGAKKKSINKHVEETKCKNKIKSDSNNRRELTPTVVNDDESPNDTKQHDDHSNVTTNQVLEEAKAQLLNRLLGGDQSSEDNDIRVNKQQQQEVSKPNISSTIEQQLEAQLSEEQDSQLTIENAEEGLKISYKLEEISFEGGKLVRDVTKHFGTILSIHKQMLTILESDTEVAQKVHITTLLNPIIVSDFTPEDSQSNNQPEEFDENKTYSGTVREWLHQKSFGFISVKLNKELQIDVFCHRSSIQSGIALSAGGSVQLRINKDQEERYIARDVYGEGVLSNSTNLKLDFPYDGVVKKWIPDKGYGFVTLSDCPSDIFCHRRSFLGSTLIPGKPIKIWLERDPHDNNKYITSWVDGPGVETQEEHSRDVSPQKDRNIITVTGIRSWAQPGKLGDCIQKKFQLNSIGYVTINKETAEATVPVSSREDFHKIGSETITWEDLEMTSPSVTVLGVPKDVSPGRVALVFCQKFNTKGVGFVDICRNSGKAFIPDVDSSILLLLKGGSISWDVLSPKTSNSAPNTPTVPDGNVSRGSLPGIPGPMIRAQPPKIPTQRKPRLGAITRAISLLKQHEQQK